MKKTPYYKIDLHTHSTESYDGGITPQQYIAALKSKKLDYIAITDHNKIQTALQLHSQFPQQIIPGEEIHTISGEIIGLYLKEYIPPGLTLTETIRRIKSQNGLVYVPHPFDRLRKGISRKDLLPHISQIDIIEAFNSRYITISPDSGNRIAQQFATTHHLPYAASSDAHSQAALGYAHSIIHQVPTPQNLPQLLQHASYQMQLALFTHRIAPRLNRLRKYIFPESHTHSTKLTLEAAT